MACCRYRVLHQRPGRCQQHAGVLWHNGYTGYRTPWSTPPPAQALPGGGAGSGKRFCRVWGMFAATAVRIDADDPLSGLELGERPEPTLPDGWTTVTVKAAALNHHDVWTLRGVGISEDLSLIHI